MCIQSCGTTVPTTHTVFLQHECSHHHCQVDSTLEVFEALLAQHRDVAQRSRSLHASCEQLVKEKVWRGMQRPERVCA